MGKINLPLLNRVGYSIFWDSNWENFFNYTNNLNKNLFIKSLLFLLLDDKIIYNFYFLSNSFCFLKKKNVDFFKNAFINNGLKKIKSYPFFNSKLWYFKYQKWCIIIFFFYNISSKNNYKNNLFIKSFYNHFFFTKKNNDFYKIINYFF